jgi:diadenosine tetraphosphate (Ap4A) HIT family hydrolase
MSLFHKLKEDKNQLLWEGENFFSLLDSFPVSPGHCLVIPQREVKNLLDLTQEEWVELKPAIEKTIGMLSEVNLVDRYSGIYEDAPNENSRKFVKEVLQFIKNRRGFYPDAYNFGVNDGHAAGRTIDHLHIHIIPRFVNDTEDPTGGVRYIFPEKGNYRK